MTKQPPSDSFAAGSNETIRPRRRTCRAILRGSWRSFGSEPRSLDFATMTDEDIDLELAELSAGRDKL